jgi:hypothetical protein
MNSQPGSTPLAGAQVYRIFSSQQKSMVSISQGSKSSHSRDQIKRKFSVTIERGYRLAEVEGSAANGARLT